MTTTRTAVRWLVLCLTVTTPHAARAQATADTVLAQIERRVAAGDRSGARALADSLLSVLPPTTEPYAEALYWRAFTSATAAEAETDYLRLGVEYPLSPRAPTALLTLAQLEYARGDRRAAQRHFDRLLREHPRGTHVAKASYWSGRLSFDDGDLARGCASLAAARQAVTPDDVELLNQIEYHSARCVAPAIDSTSVPRDSIASPGRDSVSVTPRLRTDLSIQVGAFSTKREATALATRLKTRGFLARVAGTKAPYRVRIGRYGTRAEAAAALIRVQRVSPRAIIVDAEPR